MASPGVAKDKDISRTLTKKIPKPPTGAYPTIDRQYSEYPSNSLFLDKQGSAGRKGEDEGKKGERDGDEWGGVQPQSGQLFDALYKPTKNHTILLSHSDDEEQLSLHSQSTGGSETDISLQAEGEYAAHS